MREIVVKVDPKDLGVTFKNIFSQLQKGKALEPFEYVDRDEVYKDTFEQAENFKGNK